MYGLSVKVCLRLGLLGSNEEVSSSSEQISLVYVSSAYVANHHSFSKLRHVICGCGCVGRARCGSDVGSQDLAFAELPSSALLENSGRAWNGLMEASACIQFTLMH